MKYCERLVCFTLVACVMLTYVSAIEAAPIDVTLPSEIIQHCDDQGVTETREIYSLPSDESLPDYIGSILYPEESASENLLEQIEPEEISPENPIPSTPVEENMPLSFKIEEGALRAENILVTESTQGSVSVQLQIRNDELDVMLFDEFMPFNPETLVMFEGGVRYSIALNIEYPDYIMGYYGYITIIDSITYFDDIWSIKTNKDIETIEAPSMSSTENTTAVVAAISANEGEPNNSYNQANTYIDDYDMYGTLYATSDADWFKMSWDLDGKANFYLGNIPGGCNYNLRIYYRTKNTTSYPTLYQTLATSGTYEMVTGLPVSNEREYFMEVYTVSGYSVSAKYQLRAKLTSRDGDTWENNDTAANAKSMVVQK
jgi:hypothetical protein